MDVGWLLSIINDSDAVRLNAILLVFCVLVGALAILAAEARTARIKSAEAARHRAEIYRRFMKQSE